MVGSLERAVNKRGGGGRTGRELRAVVVTWGDGGRGAGCVCVELLEAGGGG